MSLPLNNTDDIFLLELSLIKNINKFNSRQDGWEAIIEFYAHKRDHDEIIRVAKLAIKEDNLSIGGYIPFLSSLIENNKSTEALEIIQNLDAHLQSHPRIRLQTARAFVQNKNYEKSISISRDLVHINPYDPSASGLLILSLAIKNNFEILFEYISNAPPEALTADWAILAMCVHYRNSSVAETSKNSLLVAINKISKAKAPDEILWSIRLKRIAGLISYAKQELDGLDKKTLCDDRFKREMGLYIATTQDWIKGKDIYRYFFDKNDKDPDAQRLALWHKRIEVIQNNSNDCQFERNDYKFPDSLFEIFYRSTKIPYYTPIKGRVALINGTMGGGGAEKAMARTFLKMKNASNFQPELWLYSISSKYDHDIVLKGLNIPANEDEGVHVLKRRENIGMPFELFPKQFGVNASAIFDYILVRKPEVVHAWEDSVNLETAIAALWAGVRKIIIHPHNMRPDRVHRSEYISSFCRAYRELLKRTEVQFVAVSHSALSDYKTWLSIEENTRMHTVYNGFDWPDFPSETWIRDTQRKFRDRLGIPCETKLVGGIFRFAALKRPHFWAEVAQHLLQSNPDVRFILFGQGEELEKVKAYICELGVSEKFYFLGYVQTIPRDIFAINVLLHTSVTEGLPTVIIEAGSSGVPVVTTNVGGVSECIDADVSITLPLETEPDQFSVALNDVINRKLDYVSRLESANKIRSRFQINDMLKKFEDIYDCK
jgi:glycosyltransferase involved in cell wall biosynthesis